jgi:hypothetical protein
MRVKILNALLDGVRWLIWATLRNNNKSPREMHDRVRFAAPFSGLSATEVAQNAISNG